VNDKDVQDIERILHEGCPGKVMKFFSRENKVKMIYQGNCPL
jgi:hypothetical protein